MYMYVSIALTKRRALVCTYTVYSTCQMQGITRAHFSRTQHTFHMHIYIQVNGKISNFKVSSSFPVLYNTINMTLRQQSGIVWLKYTLHSYMYQLCAHEICMTTIHHCTHTCIYLTHIWHANRTHFETLYLASDRYCMHAHVHVHCRIAL